MRKSNVVFETFIILRAYFASSWVESEATKDGVDANIAKYDGEWAVQYPTVGGFSEDYGLVMKVNPLLLLFSPHN